jgi:PAS domain S-box-containing protein
VILEIGTGKLAANRTYQQMLGCTEEELQSVGILDRLTHPDDREPDKLWFRQMLDRECWDRGYGTTASRF